jgi:transposase-like protein
MSGHPAVCPWCGKDRIRGVAPSSDGNRWYRCVACATTFFIHVTSRRRLSGGAAAERAAIRDGSPPQKPVSDWT